MATLGCKGFPREQQTSDKPVKQEPSVQLLTRNNPFGTQLKCCLAYIAQATYVQLPSHGRTRARPQKSLLRYMYDRHCRASCAESH